LKLDLGKQFLRSYLEKKPSQKRAGRVPQGLGSEFKLWFHHKKKKSIKNGKSWVW
jgi:hypothetical protein